MVYIISLLIILSPSLAWCPMDPSLLTPLNAAVTQVTSPSFVPQCAGFSLIGCVALYGWYSCNEKAVKLTTLCGALASSYILYKYVHDQEEVKELVKETTEHLTQAVVASETRINANLEIIDARTQQQISYARQALQDDLAHLKTAVHQQLLELRKQNDVNKIELENSIETSATNFEHSATQRYLQLSNQIDQKKEESDKLLQESTNYMVTQMQSMVNDLARAQSITLPIQKHTFTPQNLAHRSPPPQVVRRSISQPDINDQQTQPTFAARQQDINHEFEQTKQTLRNKYAQQHEQLMQQYTTEQTALHQTQLNESGTEYQLGTPTTPVALDPLIFDAPSATPFMHRSTLTNSPTRSSWFNVFGLFSLFTG